MGRKDWWQKQVELIKQLEELSLATSLRRNPISRGSIFPEPENLALLRGSYTFFWARENQFSASSFSLVREKKTVDFFSLESKGKKWRRSSDKARRGRDDGTWKRRKERYTRYTRLGESTRMVRAWTIAVVVAVVWLKRNERDRVYPLQTHISLHIYLCTYYMHTLIHRSEIFDILSSSTSSFFSRVC